MTILHVISSMDPVNGGVCQAVRGLIDGIGDNPDCINEVVCLDEVSSPYLKNDRIPIHALGEGRGAWCRNPALMDWFEAELQRFDVVIVHGLWQYHTHATRKALKNLAKAGRRRPHYYLMPHGMLDPWFQKFSVRPLKSVRNYLFWKAAEHHAVNDADGILFTCEEEQRLAREPFRPYRPRTEHVIGLGTVVPPARHAQMTAAFEKLVPCVGQNPYILFLGRIHSKKGVDLLLSAFGKTAEAGQGTATNTPLHLVVVGPCADAEYLEELKRLSASLPNASRVHFIDMISGDAKWGAFYGSDAFVLPSHQENFGIAVVEALSCGVPVLISNKVNIWREIQAGGAGLADEDSIQGTFRLLETWNGMPLEKKQSMRENARACFATHFEIHEVAVRFLNVLSH